MQLSTYVCTYRSREVISNSITNVTPVRHVTRLQFHEVLSMHQPNSGDNSADALTKPYKHQIYTCTAIVIVIHINQPECGEEVTLSSGASTGLSYMPGGADCLLKILRRQTGSREDTFWPRNVAVKDNTFRLSSGGLIPN